MRVTAFVDGYNSMPWVSTTSGASDRRRPPPVLRRFDSTAPNYMCYRGSVLRFGKLTMVDADLQIADADPKDPFDFF